MANADRDPRRVREMFGSISRRYDALNHLLSLNLDRRWRRQAAAALAAEPDSLILDLAGGTGDLSVAVARSTAGTVVCCDFCHPMLVRAAPKLRRSGVAERCLLVEADGLRLPFPDAVFDGATVGFGVRNFADLDTGLRELLRVIKPGGRLVVLEFSAPGGRILGPLYRAYLRHVLPRIGDAASLRPGPYRYLAETIASFPDAPALAGRLREAGFAAVGWETYTGGIVAAHIAMKAIGR